MVTAASWISLELWCKGIGSGWPKAPGKLWCHTLGQWGKELLNVSSALHGEWVGGLR